MNREQINWVKEGLHKATQKHVVQHSCDSYREADHVFTCLDADTKISNRTQLLLRADGFALKLKACGEERPKALITGKPYEPIWWLWSYERRRVPEAEMAEWVSRCPFPHYPPPTGWGGPFETQKPQGQAEHPLDAQARLNGRPPCVEQARAILAGEDNWMSIEEVARKLEKEFSTPDLGRAFLVGRDVRGVGTEITDYTTDRRVLFLLRKHPVEWEVPGAGIFSNLKEAYEGAVQAIRTRDETLKEEEPKPPPVLQKTTGRSLAFACERARKREEARKKRKPLEPWKEEAIVMFRREGFEDRDIEVSRSHVSVRLTKGEILLSVYQETDLQEMREFVRKRVDEAHDRVSAVRERRDA